MDRSDRSLIEHTSEQVDFNIGMDASKALVE